MSANAHVSRARALLQDVRGTRPDDDAVIARSVELAGLLLEASLAMQTREERERAELLGALMSDPDGQAFTTLLTDRVYRSHDPARIVDAARQLLRRLGVPDYLPRFARLQMQALLRMGPFAPGKAADGLLHRLRTESSPVVLPAEEPQLSEHLALRAAEGVRVNLNHLGEAVLGEAEARARMDHYLELLARPDVESISVKVSSIHGQIDLLAWDQTLEVLVERLSELYRAALAHPYRRPDGSQLPKLVNLDMEAYADLELTLAAFRAAMDRDELLPLTAGVVLQAYLPDAAPRQRELTQWAQGRRARGGAPIRLRLVKGANLLTEQALASVRGFQVPVLPDKAQVDASYKKVLEYACEPEHADAVEVGVASHNLFDLACGMVLRASRQVEHRVSFELLEGMADHVRRAVTAVADDTLVYAPVVEEPAMQTAIAYLMRRLDENISEENFLRHSLELRVGQPQWDAQRERFERAFRERGQVSETPRRDQDRRRTPGPPHTGPFENEPDTDFTQAHNREWIWRAMDGARDADHGVVRCCIGGSDLEGDALTDGFDPSRPGHVPYRMALADAPAVERALEASRRAAASWSTVPVAERVAILRAVAARLRAARGELIALMALDGGKRIDQSDPEVSEAIDFAEFYAVNHAELDASPHLRLAPKGVVLVTPPWNFPLAIPLGGTLASLVAGNAVILKPALETPLVARRLAELCWEAGVPREALQFLVCEDSVGSLLVRDPRVDAVVLTGASDTARLFRQMRPGLDLAAETGGKNAIIVSALADRDAAIQDAVYSAFGHAGQKCSACSLLICEAEVYDDPGFLSTLRDAAASLPVGPAWDPRSFVTPLIMPARDPLLRALTTLEEGERWLLEPRRDADNLRLWSPGIKLDVQEGSFTHQTELFGPLLAVMRADDLDHALRLANGTPYGLTAGLHSLDEGEQERWSRRMRAGNLYINRAITGAIVQRQPFGGLEESSFGPGAKAGGPNYSLQLSRVTEGEPPPVVGPPAPAAADLVTHVRRRLTEAQRERLSVAACDYGRALREHFAVDHDPSGVRGERNIFRYSPCEPLLIRAGRDADSLDLLLACTAALTSGSGFELSLEPELAAAMPYHEGLPGVTSVVESPADCARRVPDYERVRALGTPEDPVLRAAEQAAIHVCTDAPMLAGRVELLRYVHEQSLSHRYHRHGNLAAARLLPELRD